MYHNCNHVSQERYVSPWTSFTQRQVFHISVNLWLTITYYLDAFPSSAAFDAINAALQSDAAERKDAVNKAKAIVAFTLKNDKGQEESWYLDLKEKGEVGKGAPKDGKKADG